MRCSFWHFYLQDRSWSDWKCFNPPKTKRNWLHVRRIWVKTHNRNRTHALHLDHIYYRSPIYITLKWDGLSHIRDARYPQYKSSKAKRFQIFSRKLVFLQSLGWINPNIKSWEFFFFKIDSIFEWILKIIFFQLNINVFN